MIFFCVFAVLFFTANIAMADANYSIVYETDNVPRETINTVYSSKGIASAIASSEHQFNYGVLGWQGSASFGTFDSNTAFSLGLAKRFKDVLINGSIVEEEGEITGGGAAVNFTF